MSEADYFIASLVFWKTCEIDFSSVLTDLPTFVAAARAFEK